MGTRRQSRESALQMMYQFDLTGNDPKEISSCYWENAEAERDAEVFANRLFDGAILHRSEIDELISMRSENWKMSRMAAVDKNILRIAVYELIHCPDVPAKVTINEAVEVAKRYGTEDSGAFVNGILDNIAKELEKMGVKKEESVE